MKSKSPEDIAVIGVDIGKDTFHLVGFDHAGERILRKKIKRLALKPTFEKFARCVVGMEACMSAHFVSRMLRRLGFEPRIIPAIYVKPFNKGQKNDYNDAEAIAEAAMRPNLRTVTEKSQDQLDLQALHRVRSRLVARRTATINQIRAFLIEQGITVRSGRHALQSSFEAILENRRDEISSRMRAILMGLYGDWLWVDERIKAISSKIEEISRSEENSVNIMTIPGIGPLISTAIVAAIGKGEVFDRGRDFAAWVGLVPRQFNTGGKTILGRISKRGNSYLRMLLVQAANVILMRPHRWDSLGLGPWLRGVVARMPHNKAAVALANKLARTAWSVLRYGSKYEVERDEALAAI
ncbi:Transposase IS116/IS110/IS902 family protein [Roseovarius litorisediminis]|uniref:Transposase IS116/IS110/IS902 family protein n=1 Tax=Roseovarius litorisediminis TaxID=1312363 RepID=A0A1Y5RDZ9_9RHOB|nr:IS110 family transposase [Roseovarius litorisediminis]SLN15250.1 Transposase IS116/IS110/IS902 family protein [Roseovarius litorisediminis]